MMKIGVIPDSFRLGFREAVETAAGMGVKGLQPFVTGGYMSPEHLTPSLRREVAAFVADKGLVFSAVCADFGLRFDGAETNKWGMQRTKWMMDLAVDLGTHIVTTHIGKVPADENSREYANMVASIEELGRYGDSIGCVFATETGPEPATELKKVPDPADTHGAQVNLDPANFVMTAGVDPVAAVYTLRDYIVHTHAKDGRYAANGGGEQPLGEGDVPYPEYLAALKNIGYDGFLTIECECGEDRVKDIQTAVDYLTGQLAKLYK